MTDVTETRLERMFPAVLFFFFFKSGTFLWLRGNRRGVHGNWEARANPCGVFFQMFLPGEGREESLLRRLRAASDPGGRRRQGLERRDTRFKGKHLVIFQIQETK